MLFTNAREPVSSSVGRAGIINKAGSVMDFEGIKTFIKDTGWGYLATTDGERPAVRPMGGGCLDRR